MNTLSEAQKAYIAGFVDGEGSISVFITRHKERNHKSFDALVRVTNTNKDVLDTLCLWTGLGFVRPQSIRRKNMAFVINRKPQWKWQVSPNQMRELLPAILPYLQVKRRVTQLVMEFLGERARPRGWNVTQKMLDKNNRIVREIQSLNVRGKGK